MMLALVAIFLTDTSALISSPMLENITSPNSLKRFFSQPLQALLFWWGCRQASCSGSIRGWWVRRPGRSFLEANACKSVSLEVGGRERPFSCSIYLMPTYTAL